MVTREISAFFSFFFNAFILQVQDQINVHSKTTRRHVHPSVGNTIHEGKTLFAS